jgi:dihydrofolate reductase
MSNIKSSRRIILDLAVTLDGFIEGQNGEVDWCIMDPDMGFTDFLNSIDTIFYGRKSYNLWGNYVPESGISDTEKEIWRLVHSKKKYVFSKTLTKVDGSAILIKDNLQDKVNKIKEESGGDIWLYGGASLITTFINLGLIDEYRLSIHPVVLGAGKPLFIDMNQRLDLNLVNINRFASGVVQLCYHPIRRNK